MKVKTGLISRDLKFSSYLKALKQMKTNFFPLFFFRRPPGIEKFKKNRFLPRTSKTKKKN